MCILSPVISHPTIYPEQKIRNASKIHTQKWSPQQISNSEKLGRTLKYEKGQKITAIIQWQRSVYKGLSSQSCGFSSSHVRMWELDHKEGWALKNWCFQTVVLEKTHWKDWCWSWSSNTLATWCKEPTHWKRPWCWERLRAGGEGSNRGWDGWMTSSTQWTWVWANSRRWWRTGKPGVLQSLRSKRVGHNRETEQQQYNGKVHIH